MIKLNLSREHKLSKGDILLGRGVRFGSECEEVFLSTKTGHFFCSQCPSWNNTDMILPAATAAIAMHHLKNEKEMLYFLPFPVRKD